jgi:CheY-like chemotaxis protein
VQTHWQAIGKRVSVGRERSQFRFGTFIAMASSRNAPTGAESRQPPGKSSVLVVEDDVDAREMFALVLGLAGHDVRTANDGEEALVVAKAFDPDVIFLDIRMPNGDGYLACEKLRMVPALRKVRIYALSGVTGTAHERRCGEAGFDGQFSKPADPDSFARLL